MAGELQIRKYREGDLEAILHLREQVFEGLDRERERRRWRWVFEANPQCGEESERSWIIEDGDRLLGHYGLIPYRIAMGERTVDGLCGVDFAVDPAAQGRGIGGQLIRRFLEPGVADFPFLVVPTPVTAHLMVKYGATLIDGESESFLYSFPTGTEMPAPEPAADLELEEVTEFDESFDVLSAAMRRIYPVQIARNAAYLNWRYRDYPFCACLSTAARGRDGELRGYIVFQPDRSAGRGYILDLVCDPQDQDAVRSLLRRAVDQARQASLPQLFLISRSETLGRLLSDCGFAVVRPHVLSFACKLPPDGFGPEAWHVSPGDGDMLFAVDG